MDHLSLLQALLTPAAQWLCGSWQTGSWFCIAKCKQLTRSWLLGYLLLGMLEGLGLRAVQKALPDNPVAQERLVGATLLAMAIADVSGFSAFRICFLVESCSFSHDAVGCCSGVVLF